MSSTSLYLLCIVLLTNLMEMTQVQQEYDDPTSLAYNVLQKEYNALFSLRFFANGRPGTGIFILKKHERSCKDRCGAVRNETLFCQCDRLCALYKDCCIDYWPVCNIKTKPFNSSIQALWQCVDVTYKKSEVKNHISPSVAYMMITKCPTTSNQTTNHSSVECILRPIANRKLSEVLPVMGDDGRGYANRHCAKCHGIHDVKNMTFWGLKVFCTGKINTTTILTYKSEYLQRNCTWYYSPPNITRFTPSPCWSTRLCDRVIETTPESKKYKDLITKCKSYMQAVNSDGKWYKNFHCVVCNGMNITEIIIPPRPIILPTLTMFFDYGSLSGDHDAPETAPEVTSPHDVIGGYVTTVGLSVSIGCQSMVVITYMWFPKLRTVPGLVLLGLSLSLISYQALLLASPLATSQLKACKGVAVLLHFTILSAFSWMTIMSYDVAKTFAMKGKSSGRSNSSTAFRRYLILALSTPAVIVGLSLILDETNAMDVGYGEFNHKSCWIGEQLALILFFHVPVGILLIFNAVALILTIISIRKVTKLTKHIQRSVKSDSRGQNAKIYSKLSVVMGVTWFLGFGQSYSIVIFYLYIIINSLQGVFIFVFFVLNKRTINLWRHEHSTRGQTTLNIRLTRKSNMGKSNMASSSTNQLHTPNEDNENGVTLSLSNLQQ